MKKYHSIIVFLLVIILGIWAIFQVKYHDVQPCTIEQYQADTLPDEFYEYIVIDDSFLVKQIDKKRFILCEQVDLGAYVQHEVKASIRNQILYIDISKGWASDERNAQGSVFYTIISIPEEQVVSEISLNYRSLVHS